MGASIEATLELWASSLRDVKAWTRPLFTQERIALSAERFVDGLPRVARQYTGSAGKITNCRIAGSKAKNGITSCQARRQAGAMEAYLPAHFSSNASSLAAAWPAVAAP